MTNLILLGAASLYRIDLTRGQSPFEGSAHIAQLNYLNPRNYSRKGKLWAWLLIVSHILCVLTAFGAVFW